MKFGEAALRLLGCARGSGQRSPCSARRFRAYAGSQSRAYVCYKRVSTHTLRVLTYLYYTPTAAKKQGLWGKKSPQSPQFTISSFSGEGWRPLEGAAQAKTGPASTFSCRFHSSCFCRAWLLSLAYLYAPVQRVEGSTEALCGSKASLSAISNTNRILVFVQSAVKSLLLQAVNHMIQHTLPDIFKPPCFAK